MPEYRPVLERARANFPAPDLSVGDVVRRRDRKRRNQRIAAGAVGIVIAIAVAAGGATLLRSSPQTATPPSPEPTVTPHPALEPILSPSEQLSTANINGPTGELVALDPSTQAKRTLVACEDPCIFIAGYALSPDGRWLAYEIWTCLGAAPCEDEAGVWVTDALGEHRQLTHACPDPERCLDGVWAWAATGATILADAQGEVVAIDPFDGSRTPLATSDLIGAIATSPDGDLVAFADRGRIRTVPIDGGSEPTTVITLDGFVDSIDWASDGTSLVADDMTHDASSVIVVSLEDGGTTTVAGGDPAEGPGEPRWSPDGSRIAYIATPGTKGHYVLELWTVAPTGSDPLRLYRGECCTEGSAGPVWSPDGSRLAFNDGNQWYVVPADGSGPAEPSTPEVAARFS